MSGIGLWIKPRLSYLHKLKILFPCSFSSIASFLFILAHGLTLSPWASPVENAAAHPQVLMPHWKQSTCWEQWHGAERRPHLYLHYGILCLKKMLEANRWGGRDLINSNEHELPSLRITAGTGSALSSVTKEGKPFLLQILVCVSEILIPASQRQKTAMCSETHFFS